MDSHSRNRTSESFEASHSLFGSRQQLWCVLFLIVYSIGMTILIAKHEVSRDEVRAYSIARAASGPIDLVRNGLVDEGHPALWYFILWMVSRIWDNYAVIKLTSFFAGMGFVAIALFASPFPLFHKLLFALGGFPLCWFSVYCRSYGLSGLLILLLASEYARKALPNPWRVGTYNALLANTNIWGAMVAGAFLLVPIYENSGTKGSWRSYLLVVAFLTAVGLALCIYTVWPTRDNMMMDRRGAQSFQAGYKNLAADMVRGVYGVLIDQQGWLQYILTGYGLRFKLLQMGFPLLATFSGVIALLAIIAVFIRWPALLMAFGSCFITAALFSMLVYPASGYHIAVIGTFLFALLWIAWSRYYSADSLFWRFITFALGLCLFSHASDGVRGAWGSLHQPFSSSKFAGAFLRQAYPAAVVICEPDFFCESLPYYTNNPIYLIRENRFGVLRWERPFNRTVTLRDVMQASAQIQKETGKITLVSLPKPIEEFEPGHFGWAYGRALEISREELQRFRESFHKVAEFTTGIETYVIYRDGRAAS